MAVVYGTPEHWLARSREARAMAEQMDDPEMKRAMLDVAEKYEMVAKRAEARDAGVEMPNFHPKNL